VISTNLIKLKTGKILADLPIK